MCSAHKKSKVQVEGRAKTAASHLTGGSFCVLSECINFSYLNAAGRIRSFPSISEITKICTLSDRLRPGELHLHHICENIVHPTEIFRQFKASFIPTEITDTAGMIVVAKFKIILRSSLNDINDPVIFISAQMRIC